MAVCQASREADRQTDMILCLVFNLTEKQENRVEGRTCPRTNVEVLDFGVGQGW